MAEHEPLNLQPLVDSYPVTEGERDIILGKSTRVDFGNDIYAEVYTSHQVVKVETPIALFNVVGIRQIDVSPTAVEFRARHLGVEAVVTISPDGTILTHISPIAPVAAAASVEAVPQPTHLRLLKPGERPEPGSEQEPITVKGNLGRDPRTVTTEQGQMYFYPFAIHHINERQQPREKQQPRWVKVGIPIGHEALIIDPGLRSEANPDGLRFREGDFTQQVLVPAEWQELSADKAKGQVRTKKVQGYFLKEVLLLKQKK